MLHKHLQSRLLLPFDLRQKYAVLRTKIEAMVHEGLLDTLVKTPRDKILDLLDSKPLR